MGLVGAGIHSDAKWDNGRREWFEKVVGLVDCDVESTTVPMIGEMTWRLLASGGHWNVTRDGRRVVCTQCGVVFGTTTGDG